MTKESFNVYMEEALVAENMNLEIAMILVKGIFDRYYLEPDIKVTIRKVSDESKRV